MHPLATLRRRGAQRARGGLDARDELEVERESFGRPS